MEIAAFRCCGETVGKVRRARGPERRGSRPWEWRRERCLDFFQAGLERPCVRDAEVSGVGVEVAVFGSVGSTTSADGAGVVEENLGSQNSTTRRTEAKMPV